MVENIKGILENGKLYFTWDTKENDKVVSHKEPFFVVENGKETINPAVDVILTEEKKKEILAKLSQKQPVVKNNAAKLSSDDAQATTAQGTNAQQDQKNNKTAKRIFTLLGLGLAGVAIGACFKACGPKLNNLEEKNKSKDITIEATATPEVTPTSTPSANLIDEALKGKYVLDEKTLNEVLAIVYDDLDTYGITDGKSDAEISSIKYDAAMATMAAQMGIVSPDLYEKFGLNQDQFISFYGNAVEFRGYIYDFNYKSIGSENPTIYPMSHMLVDPAAREVAEQAEKLAAESMKSKEAAENGVNQFIGYYQDIKPLDMHFEFKPANEFVTAPAIEATTKSAEFYGISSKTIDELRNTPENKSFAWIYKEFTNNCPSLDENIKSNQR